MHNLSFYDKTAIAMYIAELLLPIPSAAMDAVLAILKKSACEVADCSACHSGHGARAQRTIKRGVCVITWRQGRCILQEDGNLQN